MDKIPFSLYDFFAYLFSGGAILIAADYVAGSKFLWGKDAGALFILSLTLFAYVSGHIVAQISAALYENFLVRIILKKPSLLLMGDKPRAGVLKVVFPLYHRPLPGNVQSAIQQNAVADGCHATGEGLFLHAYPIVTNEQKYQARLDDFRNQYGFARNMSLAFLVSSIAIFLARWYGLHPVKLRWAALAAFGALCMLYRYLKFFRQYTFELLVRYSAMHGANLGHKK